MMTIKEELILSQRPKIKLMKLKGLLVNVPGCQIHTMYHQMLRRNYE